MKTSRRLAGLFLAIVMLFTLTVGVSATPEGTLNDGSITINDAVPGQTYRIYQILYLESYNKDSGAYAYKANSNWRTFVESAAINGKYLDVDTQGYVTWHENADAAAFAKLAQVEAAKMTPDGTATAPDAAEGKTYSTVKFDGLKLGYYLVDTTLGTLCSLDTTNPDVIMEEKNEVPTNVKTVEEDSTGTYGSTNDADIGQTINFKSTITAQAGAENYVFHDKMSEGLTFGEVTGITLAHKGGEPSPVAAENYTVKTTGLNDGCTFEVIFNQAFCDTLQANDQIVISYTATLNDKAVIGGNEGNPNDSQIEYGESGNTTKTPSSTTKTYTWKFDILKYANGNESKHLEGAQFIILNSTKDKAAVITNGKFSTWDSIENGTVLTTDANGAIHVEGLDSDTYYLREVKAPDGYNRLAEDTSFTITTNSDENKTTLTQDELIVKINNQSGTELPSTGGIGTTIFYIVGTVLVLGAAILLVTKRRMKNDQ